MKKINFKTIILTFTVVLIISLISCTNSKKYEEQEAAMIQDYLTNNPTKEFQLEPSGLYYLETKAGTGRTPIALDTAYVKYSGKFIDGSEFDTNIGTTDTLIFLVDGGVLIPGIEEGILYMKVGGKATLLIPSKLAWGPTGDNYVIPGYTPVLFDLELVKLKAGPGK
jgi:FKBP-type peptidyl-prolyl cis-trans isomerase